MAEYWGDQVNPEEDDFDLWLNIRPEDEQSEPDDDDDEEADEMNDAFNDLDALIEELGPPAVLEAVSQYLYELPRPFHRVARLARDLAARTKRAVGAIEEARQTRGR